MRLFIWTLNAYREDPPRGGRSSSRDRIEALRHGQKVTQSTTTVYRMRKKPHG